MTPDEKTIRRRTQFRQDLERMINVNSMENGSNTPDYILANYLYSCLTAFDIAVNDREQWHSKDKQRG